jgi:hypothetical protein
MQAVLRWMYGIILDNLSLHVYTRLHCSASFHYHKINNYLNYYSAVFGIYKGRGL